MRKNLSFFLSTLLLTAAFAGCGGKGSSSVSGNSTPTDETEPPETETTVPESSASSEPATQHVSPTETVSAELGSQVTVSKTISREEGSNTIKLPLADFIEEGDVVSSFTFVIYSDGADIGQFKGGCGISVDSECSAATDEGWYQSDDFSAPTQGTYGEIKWEVPGNIRDHVSPSGEVLFGYWWGNADSIRIEEVICTYTCTREIPVDGTEKYDVGKSVNYNDSDNTIKIPTADFLPEGAIPEAVTFDISSSGGFRKFTGAFGYDSPQGNYQSGDVAVFTDSSTLSLTWFVPDDAKCYTDNDGALVLGYWWSEQESATVDSVTVKYSTGGVIPDKPRQKRTEVSAEESKTGFRSSAQIVRDIKVGWNLGNTLDSYKTGKSGLDTETGWGNPKTTEDMILAVKDAGFNAIRIPVTWDEHMSGDTISREWMNRVKEVVDYAYNNDMFVILNMHHDDYIWFDPNDSEYAGDSAKLISIWKQISSEFKNYGDRLLFEGMNEPRTVGSSAEWTGGTSPERDVINKYEQDFVDTVRASGGNNAERTLIVTGYAASAEDSAMNDILVPEDDHVIVSIHYYAPWRFADGQTTSFGDSDKAELSSKFERMKKKFADAGIPVIIGEFGCVAKADDETRATYYRSYISAAKAQGIKCFIWDNGVYSGEGAYGLFNRTSLKWNETILKGVMEGTE